MMDLLSCVGAKKSTANDVLFDDDDMLGSMGLESPQLAGRKSTLLPPDSPPEAGSARSVFDNLLQGSKADKRMSVSEKPAMSGMKTQGLHLFSFHLFLILFPIFNKLSSFAYCEPLAT